VQYCHSVHPYMLRSSSSGVDAFEGCRRKMPTCSFLAMSSRNIASHIQHKLRRRGRKEWDETALPALANSPLYRNSTKTRAWSRNELGMHCFKKCYSLLPMVSYLSIPGCTIFKAVLPSMALFEGSFDIDRTSYLREDIELKSEGFDTLLAFVRHYRFMLQFR